MSIRTLPLVLALLFAACGGGDLPATQPTPVQPLTGVISTSGRTTLQYWTANYWVHDLVWESKSGLVYLAVALESAQQSSSVVAIDPQSGVVRFSVVTSSAPKNLAVSADGQFLYAHLNYTNTIKRFRLPDLRPDIEITVGASNALIEQIAVSPVRPQTLAVAGENLGPPGAGRMVIYDDATARPTSLDNGVSFSGFVWHPDGSRIYASGMFELGVDGAGVRLLKRRAAAFFGVPHYYEGVIHSKNGEVYDTATDTVRGIVADVVYAQSRAELMAQRKTFSAGNYQPRQFLAGAVLSSYDTLDLTNIDSVVLLGDKWMPDKKLISLGDSRLAMSMGNQGVAFFSGSFLHAEQVTRATQPAAIRVGAANSGSAEYWLADTGANDVATNHCNGELYLAISGFSDFSPNSVVALNPETTLVTRRVSLPGEPSRLALSDDCTFLYVGFDYNDTVVRLRTTDLSRDLTIPIKATDNDVVYARKIDVAPGRPRTILLTKGTINDGISCRSLDYGVSVVDDAVERPNTYQLPNYTTKSALWGRNANEAFAWTLIDGTVQMTIDNSGIASVSPTTNPADNFFTYFDRPTKRLYDWRRHVFDVDSQTELPIFEADWNAGMSSDCSFDTVLTTRRSTGNVFFANGKQDSNIGGYGLQIDAFDWQTRDALASVYIGLNLGWPRSMSAWGTTGLAVVTGRGDLLLLRGSSLSH